jgi:hypothetical protein
VKLGATNLSISTDLDFSVFIPHIVKMLCGHEWHVGSEINTKILLINITSNNNKMSNTMKTKTFKNLRTLVELWMHRKLVQIPTL